MKKSTEQVVASILILIGVVALCLSLLELMDMLGQGDFAGIGYMFVNPLFLLPVFFIIAGIILLYRASQNNNNSNNASNLQDTLGANEATNTGKWLLLSAGITFLLGVVVLSIACWDSCGLEGIIIVLPFITISGILGILGLILHLRNKSSDTSKNRLINIGGVILLIGFLAIPASILIRPLSVLFIPCFVLGGSLLLIGYFRNRK